MVIKKRTPEEEARAAAIDAFAGGATPAAAAPPAVEPSTPSAPAPTRRQAPPKPPADEDAESIALTMLLRFPDADLPTRLQRLAAADDRSKHYIALRALEAGLEVLER